jgi:hypothetical protein
MASIQHKADQQLFKGRGPLDAKSLVKTYSDLLNIDNWTVEGNLVAYNGMIVAVWLDKTELANNGIYYLFDPAVTSPVKKPDVTNPDHWHKISETVDLSSIETAISDHEERLTALEDDNKLHTYGYRAGFPTEGQTGHMYVAVDEQKTYVWFNNEYIPVSGSEYEEPELIFGGTAD